MKAYLVVTITCPDRPGIVERITEAMSGFAANWEESRLSRLGGDFAGIVRISVPREQAEGLAEALRALADDEFTVGIKIAEQAESATSGVDALCELRLAGADHEGIVHRISGYLAEQGVNVENMETEVSPAPVSASPLFHMEARIKVPATVSVSELRASLTHIGEELGVDIELGSVADG
jgi:glycine cleavage system regulatory protein